MGAIMSWVGVRHFGFGRNFARGYLHQGWIH